MRSFTEINPLRSYLSSIKSQGQSIGLVPTMGALHEGHIELIQHSLEENQSTVVSIFVNKAQFNNADDYANYPDQRGEDLRILKSLNCEVVFAPSSDVMYPNDSSIGFDFGPFATIMEGEYRPGHFGGVGLIISKLFNIVNPNRAYFGQKDIQQCTIIKKLTADLNFPIEIRVIPTVRGENGLALSSRNFLLTDEERVVAGHIYRILSEAREKLLNEKRSIQEVKNLIAESLNKHQMLKLEYFEIVSSQNLQPIRTIIPGEQVSLCIAAYIREVRLIDNIYLFD
jgi:pantoate--beta-alanine ligase